MTAHFNGRMPNVLIESQLHFLGERMPEFSELEIKNEPMLFNCDFTGAAYRAGPITMEFLKRLPDDWKYDRPIVVDSRVHMLMPGWYPCIPGWHHDDVPRTREDGQPNYADGQCRSEHVMALVNASVAPTEFALGTGYFMEPVFGKVIYAEWHHAVEDGIAQGHLARFQVPDRELVGFNDRTWHRGVPAVKNGWRFFIRASRYFDADGKPIARGNERTNEVRRQVQVYLDNVNEGW